MAEWVYSRDGERVVYITLRVPRSLWDQWEYRHAHFGKAIYALRESCIDIMAAQSARLHGPIQPDPFFKD